MKPEFLLQLALRAGWEDHTAQPVLGDAVLESGWYDERVVDVLFARSDKWFSWGPIIAPERRRNIFMRRAAKPDRRWCRAVAAVLLCSGWQVEPWPAPHRPIFSTADVAGILRRMWPQEGLSEMAYSSLPGVFVGLNREEYPTRLSSAILAVGPEVQAEYDELTSRIQSAHDLIMSPRERVICSGATPPQQTAAGLLADAWDRETASRLEYTGRRLSQYLYATPPQAARRRR